MYSERETKKNERKSFCYPENSGDDLTNQDFYFLFLLSEKTFYLTQFIHHHLFITKKSSQFLRNILFHFQMINFYRKHFFICFFFSHY